MYKQYVSRILPDFDGRSKLGIYATDVGYIEALPNYECKTRVLLDYYMIAVLEGKGSFVSCDKHYDIEKGDMYFLFPNVLHAYRTNEKYPLKHIWIGFNGYNASMMFDNVDIDKDSPVFRCGTKSQAFTEVIKTYEELENEAYSSALFAVSGIYRVFSDIAATKNKQLSTKQSKKFSHTVHRAIEYIESNYSNPISISMIAEFSGLSRAYFSTAFRNEVGTTPLEYLKGIRMNQADYLLRNTDLTIKDIAHSVGYDNGLYFSKDFSRIHHVPPSEYRKLKYKGAEYTKKEDNS